MAKKKKSAPQEEEMTGWQVFTYYIKEIVGALALIAFGCILYHYADDIGAWFGNLVQEAFNSLISNLGY
ncbi:MAG: hypothetical protein J6I45_03715 [Clostridia bacterium]|nr:hypothetical protein [Clostridia bacterium]